MARFDVWEIAGAPLLVVDVQADLLDALATRLVVPFVPAAKAVREEVPRLRPRLVLDGVEYVLNTPEMAAIPCQSLGRHVGSLEQQRDVIVDAIDFVLQGF